jgi:hypothetical protein
LIKINEFYPVLYILHPCILKGRLIIGLKLQELPFATVITRGNSSFRERGGVSYNKTQMARKAQISVKSPKFKGKFRGTRQLLVPAVI